MQITRRNWRWDVANGEGTVNVTPEDADDIWGLYNLITVGDEVECVTMRYPQYY
jgi:stalled ribosome rescue protein Dom34